MDLSAPPSPPSPSQPAVTGRSAWGFCCGSCCLLFLGLLIAFSFLMYRVGKNGVPSQWVDKALDAAGLSSTSTPTVPAPHSQPSEPSEEN